MELNSLKNIVFGILLFLYISIVASSFAGSKKIEDVNSLLHKLEKANNKIDSLKSDITITRSIPLLESEDISKGKFLYQKPDKFFIRFVPPRNEINVIDGKSILVYHIDINQAERYIIDNLSSGAFINSVFDFGLEGRVADIKDKYEILIVNYGEYINNKQKNRKKGKFYQVKLTPKPNKTDGNHSLIQIWIDDKLWLPVIFELHESGGEILNIMELSNIVINDYDQKEMAEFLIPDNAEILEPLN